MYDALNRNNHVTITWSRFHCEWNWW